MARLPSGRKRGRLKQARTCFPAVSAADCPVGCAALSHLRAPRGDDLPSPCAEKPDYYTAYANGILLRRVKDCQCLVVEASSTGLKVQPPCGLTRVCYAGQCAPVGAILRRGGAEGDHRKGAARRDAGRSTRARRAGAGRLGEALCRPLAGPDVGLGGRSGLRRVAAEGDGGDGRGGQRPAGHAVGLAHRCGRHDGRCPPIWRWTGGSGGNRRVAR